MAPAADAHAIVISSSGDTYPPRLSPWPAVARVPGVEPSPPVLETGYRPAATRSCVVVDD